jgi:acetyltransferase-like isoleucine patch superfamily enzyme
MTGETSSRYGWGRMMGALSLQLSKGLARVVRAWLSQGRLRAGRSVHISWDVSCIGDGEFWLGDRTVLQRGVTLRSGKGGAIHVGNDCIIEAGVVLDVAAGQFLRIGDRSIIGREVVIRSVAGVEIGSNSIIHRESVLAPREASGNGRLIIGRFVEVNANNLVDLCADVTMEDHVGTSPYCAFYTHNHLPVENGVIWEQGIDRASIFVGEGVWLSHGVLVMPGVVIGNNSVIAAGAVVNKRVEPKTIVGGVPARFLKRIGSGPATKPPDSDED